MLEDKSGWIWVGTYKGISNSTQIINLNTYSSDPFDKNSLSSNMIHGIYEDNSNNIWVGATSLKGVNIIDKKTNNIIILNTENSDLCDDSISDITRT